MISPVFSEISLGRKHSFDEECRALILFYLHTNSCIESEGGIPANMR